MRWNTRRAMQAILVVAPAVTPNTFHREALDLLPESRVWINGSSTVRSFECKAGALDVQIATTATDAVRATIAGEKAIGAVEVKIPAEQLECGNGTMNDHMRKALKAKDNPTIAFRMTSYELAKTADGAKATLTGTLSLGGTERPITVAADAKAIDGETLRVAGTHEIRMTEYGLKPPTLMLGTLKVGEKVKVSFDLVLKN
jgi:polyisoprenoid-binding protein YceI